MAKILIVEDEAILSDMYRQKFIREGCKAIDSIDAEEIMSFLEKEHFDLVLLDLMLPKEDGVSILKKIRKNLKIKDIPVVIFTNLDTPEKRKECINLGAKKYLVKAKYTPSQLINEIKDILQS